MLGKTIITAVLAVLLSPQAAAADQVYCDGNMLPDYDACQIIIDNYGVANNPVAASLTNSGNGFCPFLNPPPGVDPDSLNCRIAICFDDGNNAIFFQSIEGPYDYIRGVCQTVLPTPAGGSYHDPNIGITMSVSNNPFYNPRSKRAIVRPRRSPETVGKHEKRDGTCKDGSGTYNLIATAQHITRPSRDQFVTRLPAGSTFVVQESSTKTFTVETSISVEAGFFDLFSSTVGFSVSASDSATTTTGQTVNVDCSPGMDGVIYATPVYTEYLGFCASNNNEEIDVFIPENVQTLYRVDCLGA